MFLCMDLAHIAVYMSISVRTFLWITHYIPISNSAMQDDELLEPRLVFNVMHP